MAGPLTGIKVVELAGLGALPFGSLKLADMGAEVVRVDRLSEVPESPEPRPHNFWDRGRRSIAVDLKDPRGVETVLRLAEGADAFGNVINGNGKLHILFFEHFMQRGK